MPAGPLVGIDLGTTWSALAFLNGYGRAEVVPIADGELLVPSLVWFPPRVGEPVVGKAARKRSKEFPDGLIEFVKRDMGDPDWRRTLGGQKLTPTTVSSLILRHLVDGAAAALGARPEAAVITCPAYFGDLERQATSAAGQLAGLEVLGILNEPTAAALAYGLHHHARAGKLRALVYDLGGGTFDVTLLELEGRRVRVLATAGEHQLGGKDWDDELINWVADEFEREHGQDPREDLGVQLELRRRCEAAKIELTTQESARVFLQAFGQALKLEVTRSRFEGLTRSLLEQTRSYVDQVLGQAGLGWGEVDVVLPVGGSSRMPQVERLLTECAGRPPQRDLDPDQAVALGAAYYAAILREEEGFEVKVLAPPARARGPQRAAPSAPQTMEDVPMVLGSSLRFRPKPVLTQADRAALELDMEELARAESAPALYAVAARKGEAARPRRLEGSAAAPAPAASLAPAAPSGRPAPAPARPGPAARPPGSRPPAPRPPATRPQPAAPAARPAPPAARPVPPAARPVPSAARPAPPAARPAPPAARPAPPAARPVPPAARPVPPAARPVPPPPVPATAAAVAPEPAPQALVSFSQLAGLGDAEAGLALAVVDVNSRALSVLVFSQGRPKSSVMIPARSELPAEKVNRFFTLNDNQTGVKVVVLEGDDPDPDRCVRIGECVISGLPARPKGQEVEIVYRYDASGLIRIAARDVASRQSAQVHLQRTTGE